MMKGRIVASICGRYSVYHEGQIFTVVPRGILKKDNDRLLVGDIVQFDQELLTIDKILLRKNEIIRPRIANIDQILVVSSLEEPTFSFESIFKYLTFANFNNVHSEVIITKTDISKENIKISQIVDIFSKIGVKVHFISNKTKEGIEEIKGVFAHKVSALAGQSGVGKSSFLNSINPSYQRDIGEYSKALGRGKHQTKETILLPFSNGFIADTPGFSSLELNMSKEEIAHNFPGIKDYYARCSFTNCLHISEPNCKVKEALELEKIPRLVYDFYVKLSNEALMLYRR